MDQHLIDYLSQFLTEERFLLFKSVISNRTRYLTVVLEDIFQTQNASAPAAITIHPPTSGNEYASKFKSRLCPIMGGW